MRIRRRRAEWLVVALAVLFAAGAFGAGRGRRGAVTVKFPVGAPPPKSIRQVAVVSADTGEVLGTLAAERKRQVVLRPAPGVLYAVGADVGVRSAKTGVSHVFVVDPTTAATAPIRTSRPLAIPRTLAARPGAAAGGGPVVTMGSIPVTADGTSRTGSLGHGLLTGVFDTTHDAGVRWVNTDQKFVDVRQRDLDLQAQGRLDPTTPIRDDPLAANTRVEGELHLGSDGQMTGELRIVDLNTGDVIQRIPVDRPFDRDSMDDLRKLLGDLADEIIRRILDLLPTTTTSTTTTTTSSTASTTSSTTVSTTTTSAPPTTSTTATTTTTSSSTTTLLPCGAGLLASAEVYRNDNAGVLAVYTPPEPGTPSSEAHSHPGGPVVVNYGDAGGSGDDTWNLKATANTAVATSTGAITWAVAPCQITASGTFHEKAVGGGVDTSASTGLDARLQIKVKVKQQAPYTLTGFVRAVADPSGGLPTERYLQCTSHFGVADANLQSPTGAMIPFFEESSLHPVDELTVLCAVIRGGASTAISPNDEAMLTWSWTLTLGD